MAIKAHWIVFNKDGRILKKKPVKAWSAHQEKPPLIEIALEREYEDSDRNISVYLDTKSLIKELRFKGLI